MTIMAVKPIFSKNFKNLLFQNHWADCLETFLCSIWDSRTDKNIINAENAEKVLFLLLLCSVI